MDSEPLSRARHKHTNGWMTVLALGLLAAGFLACLYVLIGVPAQGQTVGGTTEPGVSAPTTPAPVYRRQQPLITPVAAPSPAPAQTSASPSHSDIVIDELQAELTTVHDQLRQSQEFLREAME